MPRKSKLKGGGEKNSNDTFIGILIFIIVITIVIIIIYLSMRESCGDKLNLCTDGFELKSMEYCDFFGDCDPETCCEPITCIHPDRMKKGYKDSGEGGSTSKSFKYTDFDTDGLLNASGQSGFGSISCDSPNYTGAVKIQRCTKTDKHWEYTGCTSELENCSDGDSGLSPASLQETKPRSHKECGSILYSGLFSSISDSVSLDSTKKKECDKHYSSSGKFCKLNRSDIDKCDEGTSCTLP